MPTFEQSTFSAILVALDIGLPIIGLVAAVIALAAVIHAERVEGREASHVLRLVLAGDAPASAVRVIDEHQAPETEGPATPQVPDTHL